MVADWRVAEPRSYAEANEDDRNRRPQFRRWSALLSHGVPRRRGASRTSHASAHHPQRGADGAQSGRAGKTTTTLVVGRFLAEGVRQVADAGADFYICPDNTAHIVLEQIAEDLPIPGLHIAEVVCSEIMTRGWKRVGLLGTSYTMTGPVYAKALAERGLERLIPDEPMRQRLNAAIFDELCLGIFAPETTALFVRAIADLQSEGAECVILGCTEIPLIITADNSPLPTLDSTRLLAAYAVREALSERAVRRRTGWLPVAS